MSEILVEQNCKRCINYEICQSSGCQIKKDIQNLQQENQQLKEQLEDEKLCSEIARGHNKEIRDEELKQRKEKERLQDKLKQRDEVIDEVIMELDDPFEDEDGDASWYEIAETYKSQIEIALKKLNKYKGDNNDN